MSLSPTHYYTDCSLPILVDNTLFRVPGSIMVRRSGTIRSMMEGSLRRADHHYNDSQAIVIDTISAGDFSILLSYMLMGAPFDNNDDELPQDTLITVLVTSTKLRVQDGRRFALDHIKDMSLARKLRLALDLDIPDWFDEALAKLAAQPLSVLTPSDCQILGIHLLYDVMQLREKVNALRISQAVDVPPITVDIKCSRWSTCHAGWLVIWREVLGQGLKSNAPLDSSKLDRHFKMFKDHPNGLICSTCFDTFHRELGSKGYFGEEYRMVQKEIKLIALKQGIDIFVF